MIKAGLLGASRIAPKAFITPAKARGDIQIVAVGCRDAGKGRDYIRHNELGDAVCAGYEAVCTDPAIEAVYCALPPSAHLEWVGLALENGKAVLCEKPFSMSAAQAKQMADVSKKTGALLTEGYHYCFHAAFKFVEAQLSEGAIGDIVSFRGEFSHTIPNVPGELRYKKALGGGALMDLGCYPLHAFRQLIGEPDIKSATQVITGDVDSAMTAQLACGPVSGEIICDMGPDASGKVRLDITGTNGRVTYDGFVAPQTGHKITVQRGDTVTEHAIDGLSTYRAQLDAFAAALRGEGRTLPPSDAVLQMQAIDKIYAAANMG